MCTTVAVTGENGLFFGRNMDIECGFGQRVVVTPRNYEIALRESDKIKNHYAFIGMATVINGYPLYADAVNECGLAGAGLNFPDNAYYSENVVSGKMNISPFELISFVLAKCKNIIEAKKLLQATNLVDINFSDRVKLTPLHWHFADKTGSIVFEQTQNGTFVYDNPLNVLSNNPPFEYHLQNFGMYSHLSTSNPQDIGNYNPPNASMVSQGMGAFGLPGDFSSQSRFAKAAFVLKNSKPIGSDVAQTFNILSTIQVVNGCINLGEGKDYYTMYSACIDAENQVYHCKFYNDLKFSSVDMKQCDLDSDAVIEFEV